ncbi:Hypothetical predicted protein, partial [Pelobates cultripes]
QISNLNKHEIKILKDLYNDESIVIKPADKGGGLVILSKDQYENEAYKQLNDVNTYIKLSNNPTPEMTSKLQMYLEEGKRSGILNKNELIYINIQHPRIPVIYFLPKIHKSLINPPGRPIVSGIGSLFSNLSEYIDILLQPYVEVLDQMPITFRRLLEYCFNGNVSAVYLSSHNITLENNNVDTNDMKQSLYK